MKKRTARKKAIERWINWQVKRYPDHKAPKFYLKHLRQDVTYFDKYDFRCL